MGLLPFATDPKEKEMWRLQGLLGEFAEALVIAWRDGRSKGGKAKRIGVADAHAEIIKADYDLLQRMPNLTMSSRADRVAKARKEAGKIPSSKPQIVKIIRASQGR